MSKSKPQLPSYFDHLTGLEGQDELMEVEIQLLKRSTVQPRRYFDPQAMRELESSIRDKGIQTPILVRRAGEHYEIVAGERRHRAAAAVGLRTVPVLVKDLNDEQAQELALLDNLQREDLNPIEETDGVLRLLSVKLNMSLDDAIRIIRAIYDEGRGRAGNDVVSTQAKEAVDQVFTGLGRFTPSSFYTHRVPLLRLPQELLDAVRRGELSYSKARLLAQVGDAETRNVLLNRTTVQALSIRNLSSEFPAIEEGISCT